MRMYLVSILLGLMTAIIANSKGYGFFRWWFKGTIFAPFSLLYALFMKRKIDPFRGRQSPKNGIRCPHCNEMINPDAQICHLCHKKVEIIDV